VERAEIDGVTVVWTLAPKPLRAEIKFGCGARDETLDTLGITHLAAALVESALVDAGYDGESETDLNATAFSVTGHPDVVVGYLDRVCTAAGTLPVDRLAEVAAALHPDDRTTGLDIEQVLLWRRFGRSASAAAGRPPRRASGARAGALRWTRVVRRARDRHRRRAHGGPQRRQHGRGEHAG
jgi:hypothetical protein